MLKELFDALTGQAVAANAVTVVRPDAEPDHVYYLFQQGKEPKKVEAAASPRRHRACDLQAVVAFAERCKDFGSVVWYCRTGVVCLTADEDRRDSVTLPLDLSPQMKAVQALEAIKKAMGQAEIVFALRTTFKACLGRAGNLLEVLRRVNFSASSAGGGTVEHGKRSVGKSLESQITGAAALPEYVTLDVPIFATAFPGIRGTVECALEPYPETQTFQLLPLPGEVERAVAGGEKAVGELLAQQLAEAGADGVPVYYGQP